LVFLRRWAFLLLLPFILVAASVTGSFSAETERRDPAAIAREDHKPVVADFGLGFCRQCKQQTATLKEVEAAYGDRVAVRWVHVNLEGALVERYQVEMIPLLVFFDATGKEAFRKVGPLPYKEIRDQLARMGIKEKRK
jgi:thioredoxin-like negative regulator of GroEL